MGRWGEIVARDWEDDLHNCFSFFKWFSLQHTIAAKNMKLHNTFLLQTRGEPGEHPKRDICPTCFHHTYFQ